MNPHVIDRLSAFLDGELPGAERHEVEAHLETCPSCAEHLSELALLDAAARGLEVDAPEGYFEALPGRVRQRLWGRRRVVPVWSWAAAAALLIAVLTPLVWRDPFARRATPVPQAGPPTTTAVPEAALPAAGRLGGPTSLAQPAPAAALKEARPTAPSAPIPERRADSAAPGVRNAPGRPAASSPARDLAKSEEGPAPPPAGFAPEPTGAVGATPAPAVTNEEALSTPREEPAPGKGSAQAGAGLASKARRKQDLEQDRSSEAKDSDALRSRGADSAEEARSLRERWRERARGTPEGSAGDEARLGMVEAGAVAYRLERDPRDLDILRRDAEAYLARPEARHPDRVREILRSVEEPP